MNKQVTLQTLPRRKRERQELVAKKENLNRTEVKRPQYTRVHTSYICQDGKIIENTAVDQDGDPFGEVDSIGDFIDANDLSAGSMVYTVATRITPSVYDLPSNAKWIISVAIETLPTLKYIFSPPITIQFPSPLIHGTQVYVRYVT